MDNNKLKEAKQLSDNIKNLRAKLYELEKQEKTSNFRVGGYESVFLDGIVSNEVRGLVFTILKNSAKSKLESLERQFAEL